jgi:MFS transporter, DHA1 family, multidrug resistance protein
VTSAATSVQPAGTAPGYEGWRRNLAFVWIGVFVGLVGASFVFPFMQFYIQELGVTEQSRVAYLTGITASAAGLSLTITAPIWGALADRYGRKPMFLRALIGAGITILLMGLASAVWQVVLLRFIMGAFAGTMGAAAALVAANTPREKTGQALGLLGPFLGGLVASSLGIRESFVFCAALYLTAATLAYFFVRERGMAPAASVDSGVGVKRRASGSILSNLREVASNRQVLITLALLFCLNLSNTFVRPVQPISIDGFANHLPTGDRVPIELFGYSAAWKEEFSVGVLFGVIGLTSTLAALSVSPIGSRIGYRNAVTGAALLTGLLYIPVAFVDSFGAFLLSFGAIGLFQGAMVPVTNALLAANAPDGKQGSAFGLAASMQSMALLVGPLAGGFTSGTFGNHAVYLVIGVILVLAAVGARMGIREPEIYVRSTTR